MRNATALLFSSYLSTLAELNGVDASLIAGGKKFTAAPSVQQTLETRVQESSEFLSRINIVPVDEMTGEKLGLGVSGLIAGRTDTSAGPRIPRDPTGLDVNGYTAKQTNFDTFLTYGKLDMWAKFPDFETRIRDAIVKACALDRIRIGFNGTSAAAATNAATNPLGQDVNIGWLEKIRTERPTHVFDSGAVADVISYGTDAAADYANLDALIYDAVNSVLPTYAAGDTELVALIGRDLLHDKYFPVMQAAGNVASEQVARDVVLSSKRIGGIMAAQVPFIPANAIVVTRFDNLSIYYQDGKRRRAVIDNPSRDRVDNFESSNEAYVVEDHDFAMLIENVASLNA